METILDYLSQIHWRSVAEGLAERLSTVIIGLVLAWILFFRHLRRAYLGDTDDILFHAHYLIPKGDQFVLAFRTVAPPTTISKAFDNVALQRTLRQWADRTSLEDPVLRTEGALGFEIVNDLVNLISGSLAVSAHPRDRWLLALTCEDRRVAKKKCLRVFLMKPADLSPMADWQWCREKLLVELPWHFFRVVALHAIARQYADQSTQASSTGPMNRQSLVVEPRMKQERIRLISLGISPTEVAIGEPVAPNWEEATQYLNSLGVRLTNTR